MMFREVKFDYKLFTRFLNWDHLSVSSADLVLVKNPPQPGGA